MGSYPPNNKKYPYDLRYNDFRMLRMLILYGNIKIMNLFTDPYYEILREHIDTIDDYPSPILPEALIGYIEALQAVIGEGSDLSLRTILQTKCEDWDGSFNDGFTERSNELWEAGYPLIYWPIRVIDNTTAITKCFERMEALPNNNKNFRFRDGYKIKKPNAPKDWIDEAMKLGILVLAKVSANREPVPEGNGWCCENGVCVNHHDPRAFCNMDVSRKKMPKKAQCSLFSTQCIH